MAGSAGKMIIGGTTLDSVEFSAVLPAPTFNPALAAPVPTQAMQR